MLISTYLRQRAAQPRRGCQKENRQPRFGRLHLGETMKPTRTALFAALGLALLATVAPRPTRSQSAQEPYPSMAPVEQYLIADRDQEIALARSAAPESISRDAEVMVLGRRGYESAVKGKNGFVCVVQRSWTAGPEDTDFWNPKLRAPICFNALAARTYLPRTIRKTRLVMAGRTKAQMFQEIENAIRNKELPTPEPGAMCYMLSKQGYLSDRDRNWHPHLMFFTPMTEPAAWGGGLPDSPILAFKESAQLTVFLIPVGRWSDGTSDAREQQHQH